LVFSFRIRRLVSIRPCHLSALGLDRRRLGPGDRDGHQQDGDRHGEERERVWAREISHADGHEAGHATSVARCEEVPWARS